MISKIITVLKVLLNSKILMIIISNRTKNLRDYRTFFESNDHRSLEIKNAINLKATLMLQVEYRILAILLPCCHNLLAGD